MKTTSKFGNRTWLQLKNLLTIQAGVLLLCLLAANGRAQTFTTLHSFTGGSDGSTPIGGLILSGNTLYGTAELGGASGYGTVFAINTDGTGFNVLEPFNGVNNEAYPCSLLLSGNTLYGGSQGPGVTVGTLFAVNTNGTGFTTLHTFTTISAPHYTNSDGAVSIGTTDFIGQHVVWGGVRRRHWGQWHCVRRQHQRHGLYEPA